ncbi:MAG TPA: OmpA family protein [Bacteroidales bacterium]|nr:OmpA family protein [Bacteroidales bacterium]HOK73940.1 OmpA family protein [Bacteroidales bacterium]HOM39549.1 OmpA family protein [Bacteroidales bacterium]HPP91931.1 OmpA family protein [Bacteroidales bacterium]HQG55404.1 OmpA family protein [Bacteroidales bacterium]
MSKIRGLILLVVSVLAVSSCVPGTKYKSMQDTAKMYMNERDELKTENIMLAMERKELEARVQKLEEETKSMTGELTALRSERDRLKEEYNILQGKVNDLEKAREDLIKGNVTETRRLLSELQAAQENLQKKEDLLRQLEANLDMKKASLDELSYELEKRNARMAELEKILETQKRIVQELKNKVSEALLGFENMGLSVTIRDGKVYVSLEEKLLFKTASWEIDANGRNALRKLAAVLEKNPDIQITIEGHTDNVPYNPSGGQLRDNWDLSVKRATTVVRVLLESAKIDPKRLTAAGRSQYLPVDPRNTPEARQKNRRTEIILTPDLSELYNLINKY